jgi:NAD(P)-dependent dehydrogenase (short-subunit alcohol dehydrogenase family)
VTASEVAGKVVWVTGAGRGLGRAMAVALSRAGATVALTSRTESSLLELAGELESSDVDILPASIDDARAVSAVVSEIVRRRGRLDGLVNCAGISPIFVRSEELNDDDWNRVITTNLTGTFTCCREAAKVMLPQGSGSIVNITSVHASVGSARIAAYSASKGGLDALTKTLAVEWADRGVRVNALAPGYFHTDLSADLLNSPHGEHIRASIPLGRVGKPDELTGAVLFLIGDASAYVTGSTLTVDGGWTAW